MTGFFIFIHGLACLVLIVVVLMQNGRGGGLTDSFSAAESMFGARTNEFLIRATTIVASVFLVTSLTLAFLSARQEQSLMSDEPMTIEIPMGGDEKDAAGEGVQAAAEKAAPAAAEQAAPKAVPETSPAQ